MIIAVTTIAIVLLVLCFMSVMRFETISRHNEKIERLSLLSEGDGKRICDVENRLFKAELEDRTKSYYYRQSEDNAKRIQAILKHLKLEIIDKPAETVCKSTDSTINPSMSSYSQIWIDTVLPTMTKNSKRKAK